MKIRTDFVTNSSSSSFTLTIAFDLIDGECVEFIGHGGVPEIGCIDYFIDDAIVTVSPKQLGRAKNIDQLIKLLTEGVNDGDPDYDDWYDDDCADDDCADDDCYNLGRKIFKKSEIMKSDLNGGRYDAYDFILEIKEKIKSMEK